MKKIIGGKRYNTESAKKLASYQNSNKSDFNFWEETLYRKRTGEFFLHGYGHASSKYAESIGQNQWGPGEMITPLSFENAQKWAEEHLDGDEYESIFGEVSEDGEKVITTLSLSQKAHSILKMKSSQSGMTMSEYIESLI